MLYEIALKTLENSDQPIADSFREDFPEVTQLRSVNLEAAMLPICDAVPHVGETSPSTIELLHAIQSSYKQQQWRQPYKIDDFGPAFFHGTAWFPIADADGPLVFSRGLMEIMLIDANITYPNHKHAPEELYLVLAGRVWWEAEQEKPCWKSAGEIIHHPPHIIHSLRAGDDPVLILNLWRGGGFEMPVISDA